MNLYDNELENNIIKIIDSDEVDSSKIIDVDNNDTINNIIE